MARAHPHITGIEERFGHMDRILGIQIASRDLKSYFLEKCSFPENPPKSVIFIS